MLYGRFLILICPKSGSRVSMGKHSLSFYTRHTFFFSLSRRHSVTIETWRFNLRDFLVMLLLARGRFLFTHLLPKVSLSICLTLFRIGVWQFGQATNNLDPISGYWPTQGIRPLPQARPKKREGKKKGIEEKIRCEGRWKSGPDIFIKAP